MTVPVAASENAPAFARNLATHLSEAPAEMELVFYRDLVWNADRLRAAVAHLRAVFGSRGLAAPVAIVPRNHPWHIAALAAALIDGHTLVVLSPLEPVERSTADIRAFRPAVVVAESADAVPDLRAAAVAAGSTFVELPVPGQGSAPLLTPGQGEPQDPEPGVAIVMLTSGTTGPAKRVSVRYRDIEAALTGIDRHYLGKVVTARRTAPVICPLLPVTITGLWALITALAGGAPIVLMDRFDPVPWSALVRRHRPRTLNLPPAALRMILDAQIPAGDLASVAAVWAGAAPLDPALADRFEATYGFPVLQSYGATEFTGGLAGWSLGDWKIWGATKRRSVGRLHPGVAGRTLDPETGAELTPGETGRLSFRTPHSVGAGPEDWINTNDLGRIDSDGFLFVEGRVDDVLNRGGFKVSAGKLKSVLEEHPAVREAAVVGMPDDRLGETPGALVVLRDGTDVSDDELEFWVRDRLPPYYAPTVLRRCEAIPRNGAMKIVRPAVLALLTTPKSTPRPTEPRP